MTDEDHLNSDHRPPALRQDGAEALRIIEALLFAAREPMGEDELAARLPEGADVAALIGQLQSHYALRGVNLRRIAGKWQFRTADDLSLLLHVERTDVKPLSRAALETLAIIAYHQPVTRAEIEDIRGVSTNKGSLDTLLEAGWVRIRGRRKTPGRPVTFGTTPGFLEHFGLDAVSDLPGLDELKAAGLVDGKVPVGFAIPSPSDDPALREDEEEAGQTDLDLGLAPQEEAE